jgi:hypothetical protein
VLFHRVKSPAECLFGWNRVTGPTNRGQNIFARRSRNTSRVRIWNSGGLSDVWSGAAPRHSSRNCGYGYAI